ncbi:MAG TPA: hypothetical protein VFV74_07040 [Burkholderiales bacterium]|nr:hypothetical protein [Burkholderiales bacterium]
MHKVLLIEDNFVRDIGTGARAEEGVLAQAIISLGHAMHGVRALARARAVPRQAGMKK